MEEETDCHERKGVEMYGRKLRTMTRETGAQSRSRTGWLAMFLRIYVRLYSDGGGKQFCHDAAGL